MGFEEFIPNREGYETEVEEPLVEIEKIEEKSSEKIGQEQFYDVITGKQADWQTIIYELIGSEQLDPWDIDILVLTKKFFEKVLELEEHDYYISSKILLAASLLLRIKSEFLLNKHIKSIDDVLFGKKEDKKYIYEKIIIDENDLPILIPKTPLPRSRKITLNELMSALSKAINTESRRIKKEVAIKRAKKLSEVDFPSFRKIDLKDRIKQFYAKILTTIKKTAKTPEKEINKACYSYLSGTDRDERLACFLPLLHLSNTKKLFLEQEKHLAEIEIFLYEYFDKNRDKFIEIIENEKEELTDDLVSDTDETENVNNTEDPLAKAKKARDRKKQIEEEARRELEKELHIEITDGISEMIKDELLDDLKKIENDSKIDNETGFSMSD